MQTFVNSIIGVSGGFPISERREFGFVPDEWQCLLANCSLVWVAWITLSWFNSVKYQHSSVYEKNIIIDVVSHSLLYSINDMPCAKP